MNTLFDTEEASPPEMKLTALLPWFGGKRTLAPRIVTELGPHKYYFEAGAGSMAVLFAKEPAHHETVCDLHRAMTNLAWCVQDESCAVELFGRLHRAMYSDDLYDRSKEWLSEFEAGGDPPLMPGLQTYHLHLRGEVVRASLDWAYHYFLASWMGRNGVAGTDRVNYQIATRWTAGGGSGPLRFKNAIDSIPAWWERLRNVHVLRRDMFLVLSKIEDAPGTAIYADPPYFDAGDRYQHAFKAGDHERLAQQLRRFRHARVVVSYYDHPALASLYDGWIKVDCSRPKHLSNQNRRGAVRATAPEVLLINGPSLGTTE